LPKCFHNLRLNFSRFEQENLRMRITDMIFVGSLAALVATTAPALAKNPLANPQAPKPEEQARASASPCRAYQQAADGSWTELPCQAPGSPARPQQQARDR
jgi:hypothetical protein